MFRHAAILLLALPPLASHAAGSELTETESRWLGAGAPVLRYAVERLGLPLDIVVQPRPRPGDVPFAMAYVDGRCKLVLSMRGRADDEAEAPLRGVPPDLQPSAIEAITAHELAHCWRHVQGGWLAAPAGFGAASQPSDATDDHDDGAAGRLQDMLAVRREEAYADLVALAWTARQHPERYAELQAWLSGVRGESPAAGAHHDTRAWLRKAGEAGAFARNAATPFDAARPLWLEGLSASE